MKQKYDRVEFTIWPPWSDIVGYLILVVLLLIAVICSF